MADCVLEPITTDPVIVELPLDVGESWLELHPTRARRPAATAAQNPFRRVIFMRPPLRSRGRATILPFPIGRRTIIPGMKKMILAPAVAVLFARLVFPASVATPPPPSGDARLDREIAAANSEWGPAMQAGEIEPIVRAYMDDGVFVAVDGSSIRGKAAIGDFYRDRFRKNGLAAGTRIEPRRVILDGDLAYETGYGEVTNTRNGKPVTGGGPYLTVWKKQADGEWKIVRNVILP